nr:hypothetical protein [Mammaliicoccus sp. Marseille-Q6498]
MEYKKELEEANRQIEEELAQYQVSHRETKDKKAYMSMKFLITLMLVILMLINMFHVFFQ